MSASTDDPSTTDPSAYRLPTTVVPTAYRLVLTPDLAAATFAGDVEIDLTVTETLKRNDEDCDDDAVPRPYTRSFRATYRWDAGKGAFDADEAGLGPLDKENQERF